MSTYASANSCVDRLNTEGGRDPASQLTQNADKRREQVTPAETMEEMRICQRERLSAETADKDTGLQQIAKCPSA